MINDFLSRLDKVRSVGRDRYIARCPAHDDNKPSLSLAELQDGRILIHCFAGCDPLEVLNSVGLEMTDLFPDGCLGEFRGWFKLQQDMEDKKNGVKDKEMDLELTVLALAKSDREKGIKLSAQDLEREKQAYIMVHGL